MLARLLQHPNASRFDITALVRNAEKAYADWHRDFTELHERLVEFGTVGSLPSAAAVAS